MALELRQQLKLAQQLVMTPQLQQAIKLLQLNRLELVEMIQQELEQNPLLEEGTAEPEGEAEASQSTPPEEGEPAAVLAEVTPELSFERPESLAAIDWNDYANEYSPDPAAPAFEDPMAGLPLDWSEGPDSGSSLSSAYEDRPTLSRLDVLAQKPDLQSHLRWQLCLSDLDEEEVEVGTFVIGNLNRDGFLEVTPEEIVRATGCSSAMAERLIRRVQEMDPPGIGARDVQECLLLQLEHLGAGSSLAATIVRDFLQLLETKRYAQIAKATGATEDDVIQAVRVITGLDPHPGRVYSDEHSQYIIPDVYVYKVGDEFVILLNDDGLPRLRVSSLYKDVLRNRQEASPTARTYIQDKVKAAVWLIRSIQQRQRTIYRVVESIIKFQRDFFDWGVAYLRPLILRDVAEDIGMHESTVSRVTTNKYVHTPQGIFELKYFFNTAIQRRDGGEALAAESVRERVRQIIATESAPLSDSAIAKILHKEGVEIARRTVAKYREQLGILPSHLRKRPS
ncbi:MAG: RNA polymerase factor sigma-54 [Thermodesulfobacteriota bacterium]